MSKFYLVTGIAGFIGSAVAKRLLQEGNHVTGIDNLSTGSVDAIPDGCKFIKGNCQDSAVIDQLYSQKFDTIFHIAGQSSGEISYDDPVYDLQTNTQSTLQLLQYCRDTNCKNLIYASSMSVYGDVKDEAINERVTPLPKSFYGVGKLASEHYLRSYSEEFDINTTALRLFNVYGPGQNMTNLRQGMVSIFMAQALKNDSILVKGSAERFRDFVFIDDVVEAFISADQYAINGKFNLYNVCSGVKTTVREVLDQISIALDRETEITFEGNTPGDQFGIYGDPRHASQSMNWTAQMPFSNGIAMMADWAKNILTHEL